RAALDHGAGAAPRVPDLARPAHMLRRVRRSSGWASVEPLDEGHRQLLVAHSVLPEGDRQGAAPKRGRLGDRRPDSTAPALGRLYQSRADAGATALGGG